MGMEFVNGQWQYPQAANYQTPGSYAAPAYNEPPPAGTQSQPTPSGTPNAPQDLSAYYANTYANSPSVLAASQAAATAGQQPANTLQNFGPAQGTSGNPMDWGGNYQYYTGNTFDPSTAPGYTQVPGIAGHYINPAGASWSLPGQAGSGPGSPQFAAQVQAILGTGGPQAEAMRAFLWDAQMRPQGNRSNAATPGAPSTPPAIPAATLPAPVPTPPTTPPPQQQPPTPPPVNTGGLGQGPGSFGSSMFGPPSQNRLSNYGQQDVYGQQFNVPRIPPAQLPQNPFSNAMPYGVNTGGGYGQQQGYGQQIGGAFGGQQQRSMPSPQQIQQILMQGIQSGQISPQMAQQAWGQYQQMNNAQYQQPSYQMFAGQPQSQPQQDLSYTAYVNQLNNPGVNTSGWQNLVMPPASGSPQAQAYQQWLQQQSGAQQFDGSPFGGQQQNRLSNYGNDNQSFASPASQPPQQPAAPQWQGSYQSPQDQFNNQQYQSWLNSGQPQPAQLPSSSNTPATPAWNPARPWANATQPQSSWNSTSPGLPRSQGNRFGSQQWGGGF
jgi:hypothetical protein